MCALWIMKKVAKWQCKVMCKCSYVVKEDGENRRNGVLPSSVSSSQGTTPSNPISPQSSSTSQREISTSFSSSPRRSQGGANTPRYSLSSGRAQALETRSAAWVPSRDEARSGGSTPRIFLPQIKRGKLKRRVTISSTLSGSSGSGDADEADWPPSADEDYIVFCFEEDGAFHVVMEESPRSVTRKLQCADHGNVVCACTDENKDANLPVTSRRDCLLPNKEAKVEQTSSPQSSPRLRQDSNEVLDLLSDEDKLVLRDESAESMECRNGSIESTDSSPLNWEQQLIDESNGKLGFSASPPNLIGEDDNDDNVFSAFRRDMLPKTVFEDEEIFLSPKALMERTLRIGDLLKGDNDGSCTGSDKSSSFGGSDTRDDHENQFEDNEELGSESAKSSVSNESNCSTSSFEFPVLQWEWIGTPVTWPKSGRVRFRKHKFRPAFLRIKCCRFLKV